MRGNGEMIFVACALAEVLIHGFGTSHSGQGMEEYFCTMSPVGLVWCCWILSVCLFWASMLVLAKTSACHDSERQKLSKCW